MEATVPQHILHVVKAMILPAVVCGLMATALQAQQQELQFTDVAREAGLLPAAAGMAGHAAAWGDVNGDGRPDLFSGSFHKPGTPANRFFLSTADGFKLSKNAPTDTSGRASGSVFADLDGDGDLDFYLSNLGGGKPGHAASRNLLLENKGDGKFVDVSSASGACPDAFRGRSVCLLDYDGDKRIDLLVGEGVYYGSKRRTRLFRNLGGLKFEDVSAAAGIPAVPALGVAAGDLNGDGWPDLFLAARDGGNRLLLNDGAGRFAPPHNDEQNSKVFAWDFPSGDDSTAGVALGDLNRDGRLDLVVGHHYERPWLKPEPVQVFLNMGNELQGNKNGVAAPVFRSVTTIAGVTPLPMKAPHVEIQDFDNDGWPDILTSIVKFKAGKPHPLIYRNLGNKTLQFKVSGLDANDFPTNEDRAIKRTGDFFAKMTSEKKIMYAAPAPTADFNRDGKLDIFVCSWWQDVPSLLLRNDTPGGNWLQVTAGGSGTNTMGVGCRVCIYKAGELGKPTGLLGCSEIAVGYGYSSGQEAVCHFGLADLEHCDLELALPHGGAVIQRRNVPVNQRLHIDTTPK